MTDISLKQTAKECLSETPDMSVLQDVFGYYQGAPSTLSLKEQLELVRGQSLGINIIMVAPGDFGSGAYGDIEYGIQHMRDVYAKVDIGIRELKWKKITDAKAGSKDIIDSENEAENLTNDWRVDNDYIDMFVVRQINGFAGVSAEDGPCDKKAKNSMTGSVVTLEGSQDYIGNGFAHEVGHYLGLGHDGSPSNFIQSSSDGNDTAIKSSQGNTMKGKDCFVEDVC